MSKNKNKKMTHTKKPSPSSGEADTKEERNHSFYMSKTKK